MISIDHNHHPSPPQNNNIIQDHKTFGWDDISPDGDGADLFSGALGVDSVVDINPDTFNDDFASFVHEEHLAASRPATPVKVTEGAEVISPLGDRSSSLSPLPEANSPAIGPPLTGSTLNGEENEEGETTEPQREEEEEDEEENVNNTAAVQDGKNEHDRKKEEDNQHLLNPADNVESPLSELSPPPDQDDDDDELAKPEQDEQVQSSNTNAGEASKRETSASSSTTAANANSVDATSATMAKHDSQASNPMTSGADTSSRSMSGLSSPKISANVPADGLLSIQNILAQSATPGANDARVANVLELNNELLKLGMEFQTRGIPISDHRWQAYASRLQSNLTWLAAAADRDRRMGVITLPTLEAPPSVGFYPMERIQQIYADLPTLFAKDVARRQQVNLSMMTNAAQPLAPHAGGMSGNNMGNVNPTPSLKRDRPVDETPNMADVNALKRRNTGSGMSDGNMMPPPSTSPTNPRPLSAASNQPQANMPYSAPHPAGPTSTPHMSPVSITNGLPGSISAPGPSTRSTPTPGPGPGHGHPMALPPPRASTSPHQQTPSLDLAEAQAAATNRDRMRQQQIREAQMRAHQQQQQLSAQTRELQQHQQTREAQQKQQQQMARQMPPGTPGLGGNPMNMGMGGADGSSNPAMGMNGMGGGVGQGGHGTGGSISVSNLPSEIQRQLVGILQTPGHPMVTYMHRAVPGFGQMPVQQQMQKMMMAQNMLKHQQQQQQQQQQHQHQQQQQQNQHQQGFQNPVGHANPMPQMSPPPNPQQQQQQQQGPGGMGQNPFPNIGVTPSSPVPPQSPVVPQLTGSGGMNNMNMFGVENHSSQMGAGASGGQNQGGIDPRSLPPGMNLNNMTPVQRQQLLALQAARGGSRDPSGASMGMNMGGGVGGMGSGGVGVGGGMGGMGAGMGGNAQHMMGMTPQQQQQFAMAQQERFQQQQQQRQQQQQMGMGMGMPSRDGVNPQLMAGPSIARSARSPSDAVPSPMTPRMPQQHAVPGPGMSRGPPIGSEEYSRLMQQQSIHAQRALSARSPANFHHHQQAGGGGAPGGWQGQQQSGMNMGMGGGGMGMGMNPQQQQNPSAGYGMSPPGSAGGMYTGAPSPTGSSHGGQGPMWSSTASAEHAAQMRHMSATPGPQQNMGPSSMMDPPASITSADFDLFSSWTQ